MKSTIAIIDRYPVLRKGLSFYLEEVLQDILIVSSNDLQSFLEDYSGLRPDAVIVALGQREYESNVPLIMTTKLLFDLRRVIFYDERADFAMLGDYVKIGVCNYLSKGAEIAELKKIVLDVLGGRSGVVGNAEASLKSAYMNIGGNVRLTYREYRVAVHLSEGKRVGWIADHLRKNPSNISAAKRSIFKKLDVDNVIMLRELLR